MTRARRLPPILIMKTLVSTFVAAAILSSHWTTAEIVVKSGEKIAFLGDSITQAGWGQPAGYVRLVMEGLKANGVEAVAVPAGISGHKSDQMLARLEKDVLSKEPQWMTLSCGVNDAWHGARGVPLDEEMLAEGSFNDSVAERGTYKKNITEIIDRASAAGVRPLILTATVIHEKLDGDLNKKLAPYNTFLRDLARERKLPLADLNAMFHEAIQSANQPGTNVFTYDGVHMNPEGDQLMAIGVLQAFGLDADQIGKAMTAWAPMLEEGRIANEKRDEARRARAEKAAQEKAAREQSP